MLKKQRRWLTSQADKGISLEKLYRKMDARTGGVPGILITTIKSFSKLHGARAAASMAYYALFSLFPLLIVMIAISSIFLNEQQVSQRIQNMLLDVLPVSQNLIQENIQNVMSVRNTVGVLGLVGLLWSASGVFNVLVGSINLAWDQDETRGFVQQRLLALAMIALLVIVLLILPILTGVLNVLPTLTARLIHNTVIETPIWFIYSNLLPFLITFLTLLVMYRWVPKAQVQWKDAFWGALFAALGLILVNRGFTFYITSGLSRYQLIYGSLGAVVALMTWMYLSSLILILGAHLCATVSQEHRRSKAEASTQEGKQ